MTEQSGAPNLAAGAYMSQDDVDYWENMLKAENAEHTAAQNAALAAGANPFDPQNPSHRKKISSVGGSGGSSSRSRPRRTPLAGVGRSVEPSAIPRVSARSSQRAAVGQRAVTEAQRNRASWAERPGHRARASASARASAPAPSGTTATSSKDGSSVPSPGAAPIHPAPAQTNTSRSRVRPLGAMSALEDPLPTQSMFPVPVPAPAPTASQLAEDRHRLTTVYNPLSPPPDDPTTAEGVRLGVVADRPGRLWREQLMRIGRWCHDTGNVVDGVGELDEGEKYRLDIFFRRKPVKARIPIKGGKGRRCTKTYWASRTRIQPQDVQRRREQRGPPAYEPFVRFVPDFGGVEKPTPKGAGHMEGPTPGAQNPQNPTSQGQASQGPTSQRSAIRGQRVFRRALRRPGPPLGPRPTLDGWVDDSRPVKGFEEPPRVDLGETWTRDTVDQTYSGGPINFSSRTSTGPNSLPTAPGSREAPAPSPTAQRFNRGIFKQQPEPSLTGNAKDQGKGKAKADTQAVGLLSPPIDERLNRGIVKHHLEPSVKGKGKGKAEVAAETPAPGSPVLTASAAGGIYLTPEQIIRCGGGAPNANTHPDGDPNRPQIPEVTPFDFPNVEGDSDMDSDFEVYSSEEENSGETANTNSSGSPSAWGSYGSETSRFSGEVSEEIASPPGPAHMASSPSSFSAVPAGGVRAQRSGAKRNVSWAPLPASDELGRVAGSGLKTRSGRVYSRGTRNTGRTQTGRGRLWKDGVIA